MKTVNEKSTAWLAFTNLDRTRTGALPTSMTYRIDCVTTGAEIRADTAITPAISGEVVLTPADTTLESQDNPVELRRVTITSVFGVDDQHHEVLHYEVRNLGAIT